MNKITLNLGGQDRVFYFGLGFLGSMLENENISITDFDQLKLSNPFRYYHLLMYHSLAWGYIRVNEEVPFTKLDVVNWIDEENDVIEKFEKALTQSLVKDVPVTDIKKKVTKK